MARSFGPGFRCASALKVIVQTADGIFQERRALSLAPLTGRTPLTYILIFLLAYAVLFLGMSREPGIYDEGLVLTAAMRVGAGQVPHRDFYANYGPAQFYVLAGLFKAFGRSVLIERLYDLFIKALLTACIYAITRSYCRRAVAAATAAILVVWLFALNGITGTPVVVTGLLNLIGVTLVVPVFWRRVATQRMVAAGAIAGAGVLFRYDTGIALFAIQICLTAVGVYVCSNQNWGRRFLGALWPCVLAFGAVTLLWFVSYSRVAPLQAILYDIVLYPAKHYHPGRNLPLPRVSFKHLEIMELYLLIPVVFVALYVSLADRFRSPRDQISLMQNEQWRGFAVAFGLLAFVMFFKGIVRMELQQMYLCIVPSLLLLAVLFEHMSVFSRFSRGAFLVLVSLSTVAAMWSALQEARRLQVYHFSVPEYFVRSATGTLPPLQKLWCRTSNPLTRGFCFVAASDRTQVIEFVRGHTYTGQRLYVGLPKHDRIFANDNLMYFAAERLPATMWSHFDPGMQNSLEIQSQMVRELQMYAPPYIVLDEEFAHVREPNESSISSGVTVLDDYLEQRYRPVVTFGTMAIRQLTK